MYVTKSPISQLRIGMAFCLIGLFLLISACGDVKVGDIEVRPAKNVAAGETAAVGANIENPKGKPLQIAWNAERGKVTSASESSASGIYTAPLEPGHDSINLEVRSGGKLIASKVTAINVTGRQPPPLVHKVTLSPASSDWGSPVPGSQGSVTYFLKATGALKGTVKLSGLRPQLNYTLTLNGWPGQPGNNLLPQPGTGGERYDDFGVAHIDEMGNAEVELNVPLSRGEYHVKFFVKDPDWQIVLHHDHLRFTVE